MNQFKPSMHASGEYSNKLYSAPNVILNKEERPRDAGKDRRDE